jgi:hypothetical protein
MRYTCATSTAAYPGLQYFTTLPHKRHNYKKKKKFLNTKSLLLYSIQLLSETLLILRKTERGVIKNRLLFSCKLPVILVSF